MPLRFWFKLCWSAVAVLTAALLGSIFAVFFVTRPADAVALPDITPTTTPKSTDDEKKRFEYFTVIWQVDIGKIKEKTPPPPTERNWLQQLVSRQVKINSIPADDFAVVVIGNQEQLIESRKSSNLNDLTPRWKLKLENRDVIVLKIVFNKGVKFGCDKEETWLEHKDGSRSPKKGTSQQSGSQQQPQMVNDVPGGQEVVVTPQQGNEILEHYDEHIQDLSPEAHPQGIRIRRVTPNSTAYNYGLRADDIVTSINGSPLRLGSDAQIPDLVGRLIRENRRRRTVEIEILRGSRKEKRIFRVR